MRKVFLFAGLLVFPVTAFCGNLNNCKIERSNFGSATFSLSVGNSPVDVLQGTDVNVNLQNVIAVRDRLVFERRCKMPERLSDCRITHVFGGTLSLLLGNDPIPVATFDGLQPNQNLENAVKLRDKMVQARACKFDPAVNDCRLIRTASGGVGVFSGNDLFAFGVYQSAEGTRNVENALSLRDKLIVEGVCKLPRQAIDCRIERTAAGKLGLFLGQDKFAIATWDRNRADAESLRDRLVSDDVCKFPASLQGSLEVIFGSASSDDNTQVADSQSKILKNQIVEQSLEQKSGSSAGVGL